MLNNDIKCKYMLMFPLQNLARKELICGWQRVYEIHMGPRRVGERLLHPINICYGMLSMPQHYNDVIMGVIASQITSITILYSIVYLDADQRKRQSSASLTFVRGIHREPVNSPHKWPVTRKIFPVDDVIMSTSELSVVDHTVNQQCYIDILCQNLLPRA